MRRTHKLKPPKGVAPVVVNRDFPPAVLARMEANRKGSSIMKRGGINPR